MRSPGIIPVFVLFLREQRSRFLGLTQASRMNETANHGSASEWRVVVLAGSRALASLVVLGRKVGADDGLTSQRASGR